MLNLFVSCIFLVVGQTHCQSTTLPPLPTSTTHTVRATHHHRSTQEPNAHGTIFFLYDHRSGAMLLETHSTCYVMDLTDKERAQVHNPDELEIVELKLSKIALDSTTHSSLNLTTIPAAFKSRCHRRTLVKISENMTAT